MTLSFIATWSKLIVLSYLISSVIFVVPYPKSPILNLGDIVFNHIMIASNGSTDQAFLFSFNSLLYLIHSYGLFLVYIIVEH